MSKKEILKYVFLFIFVFGVSYYIYSIPFDKNGKTQQIPADKYADTEALLIVAHADDAVLWASTILKEKDVLVVCASCGLNEEKDNELKAILKETEDQYLFLDFEETIDGEINDWIKDYDRLEIEINKTIKLRHWEEIYSHNPDGEYGNIQHKLISRIVTKNAIKERMSNNFYYFNFIAFEEFEDAKLKELSDEKLEFKDNLLSKFEYLYPSYELISHMMNYESFNKYE